MISCAAVSTSVKYICKFIKIYGRSEVNKCLVGLQERTELPLCRYLHVTAIPERRDVPSIDTSRTSGRKPTLESSLKAKSFVSDAPKKQQPFVNPLVEELSSTSDKLFNRIVVSQKSRKRREKENIILLKGLELIKVALDSDVELQYIFYSKELLLNSLPSLAIDPEKVLKLRDRTIRDSLGIKDSPGIVGVFSKPTIRPSKPSIPVTVVCTSIRDPDNMGYIIGAAAATGCKDVLLSKGCVDPWEHKVLSVAGGAHFYLPIINNIEWSDIADHIPKGAALYVADSSADISLDDSHIYSDVDYPNGSQDTPDLENINFLESQKAAVVKRPVSDAQDVVDQEIPCHLFSAVSFPKKDIVVCICGETEGVDQKIDQLAMELNGQKLKIPLENDMDSLNVSSALSVILFEIQRQFSRKKKASEL